MSLIALTRRRKARNLAHNPACTLTARLAGVDVVFVGQVHRVTEPDELERVAEVYRGGGWPADQDRTRWARGRIAEGHEIVRACLRRNQPGMFQIQAAIAAVHADAVATYQPFHAARADLLARCDRTSEADGAYERAIELTDNPVERRFLYEQRTRGVS